MDLRWSWLALLLAVAVPAIAWLSLRNRQEPEPEGLLVAHLDRLRTLPRYRALARQELVWTGVQLGAVVVVILGAVLLAARPTSAVTEDPPPRAGDLVLCLDVSAGRRADDVTLLAQARALTARLDDERVGLYGFQNTTGELMPLTDDHGFVSNRLHDAQKAFAGLGGGSGPGGSAGDGLVSCVQRFDRPAEERGRAVVLLTANGPAAGAIHSTLQAAEYAADNDVVVYAVPAGAGPAARTDLQTAAELTGGRVFDLAAKPMDQVLDLERDRLDPRPTPVRRDTPTGALVVVFCGLAVLLLAGLRGLLR